MLEKISILVADDNRELVNLLHEYLDQQSDFGVVGTVHDGAQVLDCIRSTQPDVLILDMVLPNLDGMGILERLKREGGKKPKIIMLTAFGHEQITRQAAQLGADYFIIKPFDFTLLRDTIRRVCEQPAVVVSGSAVPLASSPVEEDYTAKVSRILLDIGIPPHVKGYQYVRESILMVLQDRSLLGAVTKRLYPQVAEHFGTTSIRVERAIRHSIELAWDEHQQQFQRYGKWEGRKPPNSEFIASIAEKLTYPQF